MARERLDEIDRAGQPVQRLKVVASMQLWAFRPKGIEDQKPINTEHVCGIAFLKPLERLTALLLWDAVSLAVAFHRAFSRGSHEREP